VNYNQIYNNLISYRKKVPAKGYTENHHIVMRCMGGTDDPSNLVRLTGREHWIAHLLLNKIYRTKQTVYACHMMAMRCEERGIPRIHNSRTYEYIRKQHAKLTGQRNAKLIGEANSQFGTMWICNIELQENKKILRNDKLPEGWIVGRNKWNSPPYTDKLVREKLDKQIVITNGHIVRRLCFIDQLPIPDGWYVGHYPCPENKRSKLKEQLSGKPRPYRRGIKYNKKTTT